MRLAVLAFAGATLFRRSMESQSPASPATGMIVLQHYRIGEASNPGPYSVGGASSSSHLRPHCEDPRRWGRQAIPVSTSLSHFDDPNWSGDVDEHENDVQAAFTEPPVDEAEMDGEQTAQEGRNVRRFFEALDVDVELSAHGKLSAMAELEFCPAIIEGIVDLPTIAEQESGFRTAEGWWVPARLAQERQRHAQQRERNLGIVGRTGTSSGRPFGGGLPPQKALPSRGNQRTA